MNARTLGFAALLSSSLFATVATVASTAHAGPGVCKCNSGCHANPGQCVQGNGCSVGYAPTCGWRDGDAGVTCPKAGYISCSGECTCEPIPNFCETIGGADYCDSGPPPDTYVPDTYVEDTYVEDTYVPPDTYVEPDTYVPPDTYVEPDTYVPPDTYVEPDTYVPPDTYVEPDTYVPPPVDSCVPFPCPPGTTAVPIPGACDPFCAQPCGGGEFKCAGLLGTTCVGGACIPQCLITGCADCQSCSLGDGTCYDEPMSCADGGTASDSGATSSDAASSSDAATTADASTSADSTVADTTLDDATADTVGHPFAPASTPEASTADTGGCGCRVQGERTTWSSASIALLAALAFFRRSKKR